MAGRRRPRRLGGVRLVGSASPGEPGELIDEREALPARPHLLHLLPGFSPHEQGERAGGRDCARAASRAGHVTEAAPGCLVRMGTARNPTESTSPELRFRLGGLSSRGGRGSVCAKPRLRPQHSPTTSWKVEAGGCGLQGHPQLPCEFEASLGYLNPCLRFINTYIRKQTESKQLLPFPQGKKN